MSFDYVNLEGRIVFLSSIPSGFYTLSPPLSHGSLSLNRNYLMEKSYLVLSVPKSLTRCIMWAFVLLPGATVEASLMIVEQGTYLGAQELI